MSYHFNDIEAKWQKYWAENQTFKAQNNADKPKYFVLDMFPYPSGAGLHVGHPLGYIASDIYARYKRHKGFNVLHPQGYDSFGLPAEQYAIQTGQHPAITTETNIKTYRKQLDQIGFSFDWSREVRTSDPKYYKWTQWIFIQLFNSWYHKTSDKAEAIETLISIFETEGNAKVKAACDDDISIFSADEWRQMSSEQQQKILLKYRLSFLSETEVNWCPALGTVLANDEIVGGVSERGGHPVIRKKMMQWSMRITAYAQRLLDGLAKIDWPQPLKDSQTYWIGRSEGAMVEFKVLSPALPINRDRLSKGKEADSDKGDPGYLTGNPETASVLLERAKEMRANPTKSEAILWQYLKGKKLNVKFRQQHLIGDYIVDFVCLSKRLVIEVDGRIHDFQIEKDNSRTQFLGDRGFKVIRFKNEEVIGNIEGVIAKIKKELLSPTFPINRDRLSEEMRANENNEVLPLGKDLGWDKKLLSPALPINRDRLSEGKGASKNNEVLPLGKDLGWDEQVLSPALPINRDRLSEGKGASKNNEVLPLGKDLGWEIPVFTTRPDTIFGVSFMTLAPEHELVAKITTPEQKSAVAAYIKSTSKRSELERMSDVKTISGAFTGAFALHPFTGKKIPIWIGDYVLAGYGTGAVMAVPCGDQRDYDFAKHFNLEIPNIFKDVDISKEAFVDKDQTVIANSDFLNDLPYKKAMKRIIFEIEQRNFGYGKVNYRLRDAVFSRQRYWGEPFPVYYQNGLPQMIDPKYLPISLPEVEKYLPTEDGKPPLGNATVWAWDTKKLAVVSNQLIDHNRVFPLELNTMPGWAGSSSYFNRYMDPHNTKEFASKEAVNYWQDVDLYIGGSEHATGHLLYSRFWQKFLFDKGIVPVDEYAKKLINQGMILGTSAFVYRWEYGLQSDSINVARKPIYISKGLIEKAVKSALMISEISEELSKIYTDLIGYHKSLRESPAEWSHFTPIHADVSFVNASDELDVVAFKKWRPEYKEAIFIGENGKILSPILPINQDSLSEGKGANESNEVLPLGKDLGWDKYICGREVEKMSKSKYNVVNPDQICEEYGADSLRMFEMFLGPLEQAKPWNTAGISGVHSFLKKLWRLYHQDAIFSISEAIPSKEEFKILHKTIKKVEEDIENFSFNTSVSTFMIAVNELTALKCNKRAILEPLAILIEPYAPHIAEELWQKLGHNQSVSTADFPKFDGKYLVESSKVYPISFNGKMKFTLELPLDLSKEEIEIAVMAHEKTQQNLQGRIPKNVIIVPGKIVNIVG